jgi:hypothetical protein
MTTPVYTLLVETGRAPEDGLPEGATGAALLCYAAAKDEATAVRETVEVLRTAGMAPLEVQSYGAQDEREREEDGLEAAERALMARARDENAVIVAQATPFFD